MFFNEILGNLFEVPNVNLACEEFEFILSYAVYLLEILGVVIVSLFLYIYNTCYMLN
jgi:hypothetical protein